MPTDQGSAIGAESLAPVVEDMSIFLMAGRMKHVPGRGYEASRGVWGDRLPLAEQAVLAERLGFRRAWLSERYNLKEAGVLLGGAGALTSRIGLGTGAIFAGARPPIVTASLGATMNAAYGPRFTLGLGRGLHLLYKGYGFPEGGEVSYDSLIDYATLIRRLWQGETVTYDGQAGKLEQLKMLDLPDTPPELWFVHLGGPKASKIAAHPVFDGAVLGDLLNPIATRKSVTVSRQECERIGRDPASLRICQCVVTAPDCDEEETAELVHARIVGILQIAGMGEIYSRLNEWDPNVMRAVREHPKFQNLDQATADLSFHRSDVVEVGRILPDDLVRTTAGVGSTEDCLKTVQAFRDAGADEVALYGSTPAQNAKLIAAWADHTRQREEL